MAMGSWQLGARGWVPAFARTREGGWRGVTPIQTFPPQGGRVRGLEGRNNLHVVVDHLHLSPLTNDEVHDGL